MPYVPPINTNIPFTFTSRGYGPIDVTAIDFRFISSTMSSVLSATIMGQPLYQTEAYTYPKQCKKVAIGFGDDIQILSLPCLYGGIRDLGSLIRVHQREYLSLTANIFTFINASLDLPASIIVDDAGNKDNLSGSITADFPKNLFSIIAAHSPESIRATIGAQSPLDLSGILHSYQVDNITSIIRTALPNDLQALITTDTPYDLLSSIVMHTPIDIAALLSSTLPGNITGTLHSWQLAQLGSEIKQHTPVDLYSGIGAHFPSNIEAIISAHPPANIDALLNPIPPINIIGSLHGWQVAYLDAEIALDLPRNLNSEILIHSPYNVTATMGGHLPKNLLANVESHLYINLLGVAHGWQLDNIKAYIAMALPKNLSAEVVLDNPLDLFGLLIPAVSGNLISFITGHAPNFIQGSIHGWQTSTIYSNIDSDLPKDLLGYLNSFQTYYLNILSNMSGQLPIDIKAAIYAASPKDLVTNIHGWQLAYLNFSVSTQLPIDLSGELRAAYPNNLLAYIGTHAPYNMSATMHGWDTLNLVSSLFIGYPFNLSSYIASDMPKDLLAYVDVLKRKEQLFPAFIGVDTPNNLIAIMGAHAPSNLSGTTHGWQLLDLSSDIAMHIPNNLFASIVLQPPGNLIGYIKSFQTSNFNLFSRIHGWQFYNLLGAIDTHSPANLLAYVPVYRRDYFDISARTHGWQEFNLTAFIKNCFDYTLLANIIVDLPKNLSATLRVWNSSTINGSLHSWAMDSFLASIHPFCKTDLVSYLLPIPPSDLKGLIRAIAHGSHNLYTYIRAFQIRSLSGSLYPLYINDLTSYLYPIGSINLGARVHSYDERFISGYLLGLDYPYNLTASLFASGRLANLSASIRAFQALNVFENLSCTLSGYQQTTLFANLFPIGGYDLTAMINSSSYSFNLQALLTPKTVRLSKIVNIFTVEKYDLSAMINTSCFGSNISHISAYIKTIYLRPLSATLNGVVVYKDSLGLTATIGYDSQVIVMDKLNIKFKTLGSVAKVVDTLPLFVHIYGAYRSISASISCMISYNNLTAQIKAVGTEDYAIIKNVSKALVYDLKSTYGRAELIKIVELSFRSYIRDYIYLQKANVSFNRFPGEKWEVDIMSYLPANVTLRTKRKFFKATTLYKLTPYKSIDDAVKEAIVYVTEIPYNNLSAAINLYYNSMSVNLLAKISPLYVKSNQSDLASIITGDTPPVFFSKGEEGFVGVV